MAPYEPGDDLGEAQPAQKMQFSSTLDNLYLLAQGELGSLPVLHTNLAQTHKCHGAMLSCKPFLMGISAVEEGVDTPQLGPQEL